MAGRKLDFCWPDREVCLNDCLLGMYTVWLGGNWTFTDLKGKYAWMIVFWTGAVHLSFSPKLGRKCTDRHPSMLLMPYENSFETTTATRIRLVLRLYSQPKHQWEGTVPQSSTFSLQPQKPAGHARQVLELDRCWNRHSAPRCIPICLSPVVPLSLHWFLLSWEGVWERRRWNSPKEMVHCQCVG